MAQIEVSLVFDFVKAKCPSKQFFSHVGTEPPIPGYGIPLILGGLRPSKQLFSTQALSKFVALCWGTLKPINFSKP